MKCGVFAFVTSCPTQIYTKNGVKAPREFDLHLCHSVRFSLLLNLPLKQYKVLHSQFRPFEVGAPNQVVTR